MSELTIGVHKLFADVKDFEYGTAGSACFDIRAYLKNQETINFFNGTDSIGTVRKHQRMVSDELTIIVGAGEVALIPTGAIFDIPAGYKLNVYVRSGISFKKNVSLANGVGIIDYDYTDQLMILLRNNGLTAITIEHNERIAQAELVPITQARLVNKVGDLSQKTDRDGGLGHTGSF